MKILFISLGCDKNLVDSEEMLGLLKRAGHEITNEESEAEIAVINTCSFIHDAKDESVETVLEMCELKKNGMLKGIILTGCLVQYYQGDIKKELPEVDAVLGTTSYEDIVNAVAAVCKGEYMEVYKSIDYLPRFTADRIVTTGGFTAYLKIAEGCDKHCTYCVIPSLRGRYRSVPLEDVLECANRLAADGIRELVIVAQETTVYGLDLYGKKMLPELLRRLADIEGLYWLRLLYCYPEEIDEALIAEMARNPKVCHYIDMPIQHASDAVLRRMGRRTTQAEIREKIAALRAAMPDIVLRTTLIAGFPGETEEDHALAMDFIDEMEFQRLGVFTYSCEENTPAAKLTPQIPQEQAEGWKEELMALQQEISYDLNTAMKGKLLEAVIEGYLYEEDVYVARSYMDAPNVDGYVFVSSSRELMSGSLVKVRITDCSEYDLIGELADEFTE
ncbi:MAG: 30S ribosomal protein S12 methylthiotransferase RimO [Lachnospiraceae bacterium]|nr:30S ribosomal protein S12 methylthiotransferase RimO [Lachnospiraceae bacterium]